MQGNQWIDYYREKQGSRYRLFCLPYAGGAASKYAMWKKFVPAYAEVVPVQLPGRESRIKEALPTDLMDLSENIAEQIVCFSKDAKPYSVFGHSMGGMIAFETVKALEKMGQHPDYCFISATDFVSMDELPPVSAITDDDFLEFTARYGAVDELNLLKKFPGFFRLIMKIMRSDFQMLQGYTLDGASKIDAPICAFSYQDDKLASPELMEKWKRYTKGGYRCECYPGDHFSLFHDCEIIIRSIFKRIEEKRKYGYENDRQLAEAI